ncbi:MAG: DUF308 domain-containing protein [Veillonella parvula]
MSGSSKFFFIVSGIVSIILGIFLLLNPVINLMAFAWLFSIIFFVSAVSSIINYFYVAGWLHVAGISWHYQCSIRYLSRMRRICIPTVSIPDHNRHLDGI